ncbi:dockerin type I domain-containing protein [Anatilimnocola sp. NA78]|uniref:dockerin type I domain-containing protein n=1 Tax=Anatilimnocola sp. NA78 TaxID=3415683 RepID=UPI003CE59CFF
MQFLSHRRTQPTVHQAAQAGETAAKPRRTVRASGGPASSGMRRRAFFETLEARTVFAPLGAFPDDTAEYMLGDILITVVLMESDPTLPGADPSTENWTASTINALQAKVQEGMTWWKDTFNNISGFYSNPALPLVNFKYDWTWALDPVETMYEPINRYSSVHELWVNDFLDRPDVNFAQSLDIYKDIKAFNNFQREKHNTDWAFTIFVANSTNDGDDFFPLNPSPAPDEVNYRGAFAFLGGQFVVVPSDRPAMTFAHEVGHMFYALDEYSNGHSYGAKSGYYNTQNTNGANGNPTENFLGVQQPSIMATGSGQLQAWLEHISSTSSKEAIGWKDSDGDGVLDVNDVSFTLIGKGSYNSSTGTYRFQGTSSVRTLPNKNTFGGPNANVVYNDISINKIRRAEYSLDGGSWTTITDFVDTPTTANFDLSIPITAGEHTLQIRTFDGRTGASSDIFTAEINSPGEATPPQLTTSPGTVSGFAYRDDNGNGRWDANEPGLGDWGFEVRDLDDHLLTLAHSLRPSDYANNTVLNTIMPGVTLSTIGVTAGGDLVMSRISSRAGGSIFYAGSTANETYGTLRNPSNTNTLLFDRRLKIEFASPVTSVSLRAISAAIGSGKGSVGQLEAYDANNNLIGRYTTGALGVGQSEMMSITHGVADIKYVIARGHLETEVMFDSLNWGPATSTTTNPDGSFSLAALPAGTYNLKIVPASPNYNAITPLEGRTTITIPANGGPPANLYFAYQFGGNPWHNLLDPLNTTGGGGITAFDALLIINYLNLHPAGNTLVASEAIPGHYLDVDNNNKCTAFDALLVINYLNQNPIGGGGGGGGEAVAPPTTPPAIVAGGNGNGGSGGGELAPAQTADEYFARLPFHGTPIREDHHDHVHVEDLVEAHFELDGFDHHGIEHDQHDHEEFVLATGNDDNASEFTLFGNADPLAYQESDSDTESELIPALATTSTTGISPLLERLRDLRLSREEADIVPARKAQLLRARFEQLLAVLSGDQDRLANLGGQPPAAG